MQPFATPCNEFLPAPADEMQGIVATDGAPIDTDVASRISSVCIGVPSVAKNGSQNCMCCGDESQDYVKWNEMEQNGTRFNSN